MSDLSDVVSITVTTQNPGVTQAGFGVPLIVSHSAGWVERTRSYATLAEVATDFASTTVEYAAASQIFSQSPTVELIKIGRAVGVPTQRFSVGVFAVANSTVYSLRIKSIGGSYQTASYTSDGTATNDEIVTGLQAAIDALASPAVSGVGAGQVTTSLQGSSGSKTLRILANTAGNFWSVEITDPAKLTNAQDHANTSPTIQADLAAIALEDNGWYGLVTLFNSSAMVEAAATWCETANKLYRVASLDSGIIQVVYGSATDIAHTLAAAARRQTSVFYHPDASEFPDAASFGRWFPIDPGSDDWRMKTLSGVTAQGITSTWKTNAEAKFAAFYYDFGGVSVVGGDAKVAGDEYIDVIRGLAWYEARLGERIANLIIQNEKIPYTDAGVALIEAQVIAMNTEGIRRGLIRSDPAPVVTVPKVASVSGADRAARLLPDVNTAWQLAGAIHKVDVNVAVSV